LKWFVYVEETHKNTLTNYAEVLKNSIESP